MEVRSSEYGHRAVFFSRLAEKTDAHLVEWGPREIAVPSGSSLDCHAHVYLNGISTTEDEARQWCSRVGAHFLGLSSNELCFAVSGFSRYKYIDSDEDEEEVHEQDEDKAEANIASARRSLGSAGRTPRRRQQFKENVDGYSDSPKDPIKELRFKPTPTESDNWEKERVDEAQGENESGDIVRGGRGFKWELDDDETPPESESEAPAVEFEEPSPVFLRPSLPPQFAPENSSGRRLLSALFESDPLKTDVSPVQHLQEGEDDIMRDVTPAKHLLNRSRLLDEQGESKRSPFASPGSADAMDTAESGESETELKSGKTGFIRGSFERSSLPFPGIAQSVTAGLEGNFLDLNLALGRSFRVGFGNLGMIVAPSFGDIPHPGYTVPGFRASLENVHGSGSALPRIWFVDILRIHLSLWRMHETDMMDAEVSSATVNVPSGQNSNSAKRLVKTPSLLQAFSDPKVVAGFLQSAITEFEQCAKDDSNYTHGLILFGLLQALYKFNDSPLSGSSQNLIGRLASWGRGTAGTYFDSAIPEEPSLRRALLLLTIGDVENSVTSASSCGYMRLALMIARALEVPKHDLRSDAEAQLRSYVPSSSVDDGLNFETNDFSAENENEKFDLSFLHNYSSSSVSIDEVMILMLLSGRVSPVAHFLKLSWYRLFIMELLHGVGSSEASQPERVFAVVESLEKSGISTIAPHRSSHDIDCAFHLLKLYADPTASYAVTSGIYSSRGIGTHNEPLDGRVPWFLHQVLSALVGQASTPRVAWQLAEAYALQLSASGLHLWSFYVLCSGNPPMGLLKQTLIRNWPYIQDDKIEYEMKAESIVTLASESEAAIDEEPPPTSSSFVSAETFLISILGVPMEWINEAKAVYCHYEGDVMNECLYWLATNSETSRNIAHEILAREIFPKAIATYDNESLIEIGKLLERLQSYSDIANWSTEGGLILDYIIYVADSENMKPVNMSALQTMARRVCVYEERASTTYQKHAATTMADGILAAERAAALLATEDLIGVFDQAAADLNALPVSRGAKLRTIAEYRIQSEHGTAFANRLASALPLYSPYLFPKVEDQA